MDEYIDMVVDYFNRNLTQYKLIMKGKHGPYWWVEYQYKDLTIYVQGDFCFGIDLIRGEERRDLADYYSIPKERYDAGLENFEYQLNVMMKVLEKHYPDYL